MDPFTLGALGVGAFVVLRNRAAKKGAAAPQSEPVDAPPPAVAVFVPPAPVEAPVAPMPAAEPIFRAAVQPQRSAPVADVYVPPAPAPAAPPVYAPPPPPPPPPVAVAAPPPPPALPTPKFNWANPWITLNTPDGRQVQCPIIDNAAFAYIYTRGRFYFENNDAGGVRYEQTLVEFRHFDPTQGPAPVQQLTERYGVLCDVEDAAMWDAQIGWNVYGDSWQSPWPDSYALKQRFPQYSGGYVPPPAPVYVPPPAPVYVPPVPVEPVYEAPRPQVGIKGPRYVADY
jgi:hypothetical protein